MSEKTKNYEVEPKPQLFRVVLVGHTDGHGARCVVTDIMPDYLEHVGTSQIIDEGLPSERLAYSGSTHIDGLEELDEVWERDRVVNGMVATFGADRPGVREKVESMFAG